MAVRQDDRFFFVAAALVWAVASLSAASLARRSDLSRGGLILNSPRLSLTLRFRLRCLLIGLLLFLELRFSPGPSLFGTAAHRYLLDASEPGYTNRRSHGH